MEYVLEILLITILIIIIIVFLIYSKYIIGSVTNDTFNSKIFGKSSHELLKVENVYDNQVIVPTMQLPSNLIIEKNKLFEITDKSVVARISEVIPHASELVAKSINNKTLNEQILYIAKLPQYANLVKSKNTDGAVRGFYRGTNGIKGHANFVKFDPNNASKAATMANGLAEAINVSSLIVGQYYLSEINSKLISINDKLDKISDFQNRELKSKILSLLLQVEKITTFSTEIIENDDLRNRKLQTLEILEGTGSQLLQQVNLAISDLIMKNQKIDYKEYQKRVSEFGGLVEYQQVLISILEEISKLTYLLGKGKISNEMSYAVYSKYLEQSTNVHNRLIEWHENQIKIHGIEIDKNRKQKKNIEGFFATIPGLVDDKWRYKVLKNNLREKIIAQKETNLLIISNQALYNMNVQIIIKDGKYFYLKEPFV